MGSNFLNRTLCTVNEKIKERQDYVRERKLIMSHLTIKEAEKVYKTYIGKELIKIVRDPRDDYKDKKVELTINEIKTRISRKLNKEQIFEVVPRLKKIIK